MNKRQFESWCCENGYITTNDWNYQSIAGLDYYFIINPKTDKFALIQQNCEVGTYHTLVWDWVDFNGWAEQFHKETGGIWK